MEWKLRLYLVGKNNLYLKCLEGKNPFVILIRRKKKSIILTYLWAFSSILCILAKHKLVDTKTVNKSVEKSVYSVEKF